MRRTAARVLVLMLAALLPMAGIASAQEETGAAQAVPQESPTKQEPTPEQIAGRAPLPGVDPMLAQPPAETQIDTYFWRRLAQERSQRAAATRPSMSARAAEALAPVPTVEELEPDTLFGRNDTLRTAQFIPELGTGDGEVPEVEIEGTIFDVPVPSASVTPTEDDGSIPLANATPLGGSVQVVTASGEVGDGPHGSAGDGTGDFDFYEITGAEEGEELVVDIDAEANGSTLDSYVQVFDAAGELVAENDDGFQPDSILDSFLSVELPAAGDYYVMVAGFLSLPADPFDSGSGPGADSEGPYDVEMTLGALPEDIDVYAFDLEPGDVLGATVTGGASRLEVFEEDGTLVQGSESDNSYIYPEDTQLVGGGNSVVDHVADVAGRHYLAVSDGPGDYEVQLRLRRPPLESDDPGSVQILFLDYDGATINTAIFGGPGVRTLTGLGGFLGGWGLGSDDEDAVIDAINASVAENIQADLEERGLNDDFEIEIRNSRDHPDPWGEENVSRVIVGGTIPESGIPTIGIAQTIDPGNFDQEESALVLLDLLSGPATNPNSLNQFVGPETDIVELVGVGVGNITAHEAGHFFGNFHTANFNEPNIQDQGGNLANIVGVGPDRIFGTADDIDVDFGEDIYAPSEPFTGIEDTLTRISQVLTTPGPGTPAAVAGVSAYRFLDRVTVNWTAVDGAEGYTVQALRNGEVVRSGEAAAGATTYRFRNLPRGTYIFTVSATNAHGAGPAGTSAQVTVR